MKRLGAAGLIWVVAGTFAPGMRAEVSKCGAKVQVIEVRSEKPQAVSGVLVSLPVKLRVVTRPTCVAKPDEAKDIRLLVAKESVGKVKDGASILVRYERRKSGDFWLFVGTPDEWLGNS